MKLKIIFILAESIPLNQKTQTMLSLLGKINTIIVYKIHSTKASIGKPWKISNTLKVIIIKTLQLCTSN